MGINRSREKLEEIEIPETQPFKLITRTSRTLVADYDPATDEWDWKSTSVIGGATGSVMKKHSEYVGDGSAKSFQVTHNFGTRDVTVAIYESASPNTVVNPTVEYSDPDYVTVTFGTAPSLDEYRVVVIG